MEKKTKKNIKNRDINEKRGMHVRINPQAVECVASAAKSIALDTWFGQMIAIFKHRKAMWSIKSIIIKKWRKMWCNYPGWSAEELASG